MYSSVAARKQSQLQSRIPAEWRIQGALGLEPLDTKYDRVTVMDVPRTCGLLSAQELDITENYDVPGLLAKIREVSCEVVVRAFCKVCYTSENIQNIKLIGDGMKRAAIAHQVTRCLTEPLFEEALAQARALDAHAKAGGVKGPLHGLPVSLKDTFNVPGVDSSIGLALLAFQPKEPSQTAALATLLTSLGAVIVAKTNVPQTLGALDSCNNLFGRTLNPLNWQLSAGGSSGGEGVLVAMRGCMVGFGTDIGGSIRVPAMCQGVYGLKPSTGRVPFGGQEMAFLDGKGRIALQTVAGPLARSVGDLDAVMREIVPRAELFEDGLPGSWPGSSGPSPKMTIGILRKDGLVEPLPPIAKILDEVSHKLRATEVNVVEIPVPPVLKKCQALAGKLMGVDDNAPAMDLLERAGEPLIPWLAGRMKRTKALTVQQLAQLQAQRSTIEREMLAMWTGGAPPGSPRKVDAIVLPVAPHPVPEIDRYGGVGYTSSFVLLDYPAGVVPVRKFNEGDLELGTEMAAPVDGVWDKVNRALCMFMSHSL